MKILKCMIFIGIFVMLQSYALSGQTKLDITLQGKGTVAEKQGMEQIYVEGTAKGDITGTFIWQEEHEPAFELGKDVEKGTITITDQNGDKLVLKFSGKAKKTGVEESDLEGAEGGFTYLEGTGHWAGKRVEGTYSMAGVFQKDSVEITASLTVEVK